MKVGSFVAVHMWRKRRFVGVCISIRRKGATFTIRSPAGMDYTFPIYSPLILGIEKRRSRIKHTVHKAKFYRR